MSLSSNGDLVYSERIRRASEGYVSELSERFLRSPSYFSPGELQQEVTKMSAKKAQELFGTEQERETWIESIRSSVEQSLQNQVRAALGTPPDVKRKRERKQQENDDNTSNNSLKNSCQNSKSRTFSYLEDTDDRFKFQRDKLRPDKEEELSCSSQNTTTKRYLDPLSDDFNKIFSPYTRAALENVGYSGSKLTAIRKAPSQPFKRASGNLWVDSQGVEHELPGPFWPKDHLPLFSNQKHLNYVPNFTEPLNTPGTQGTVKEEVSGLFPRQWKGTALVYDRSNVKLCPNAPTGCIPNLKFESRFECGNLQQAKRVGPCEYDLILTTDLYTKRHTQWYYFRVENMVSGVTYKFNIVNLLKKDSLYNYGMKPLVYSQKQADKDNIGWRRAGHSITYTRNISPKYNPLLTKDLMYYVLSFQMEFSHSSDTCYLAHCYPYSYSDLDLYLRTLVDSPATSQFVRKEVLCKTRAGNSCHVLTITSSQVHDSKKLGVVISARVHPGETNASWMMKGVMDYLTSNDPVAKSLREKFVFKIVPMLNPDGVIVGNYRTNLAAKDLNRTYKEPDKNNFPTVWHTKAMLESFRENHQVIIYCDLHGHSRKPNVFMYGCTADPAMGSVSNFLEERLFPWMMSQKAPDKFSFQGCKFIVRKCKESTARVVMWRQLGIMNSFTMEATFCGANFGDMEKGRHFNTHDFEDMGRHFCEVLMEYSEAKSVNRNEMTQAFVELACKMTRDILRQNLGSFKLLNNIGNTNKQLTYSTTNEHKSNQSSIEQDPTKQLQFLTSYKDGIRISPAVKDVNFVDVNVQCSGKSKRNGEVATNSGDYEVAVKSIHVDSFNDCIKILEGLRLTQCYDESDSSDSDSEPEDIDGNPRKGNETKRKKKKKKRKQNWWETLSKTGQDTSKDNKHVEDEEQARPEECKVRTSFGKFVNPYTNRFNNGIPVYSQERIRERNRKKELEKEAEEKEKAEGQANGDVSSGSESVIAFTDDTELNFVTAQRRLTYFMMNKPRPTNYVRSVSHPNMKVIPSYNDVVNSQSFKMDHLEGGGYGFAFKFPAKNGQQERRESLQRYHRNTRSDSLQSFEEARSINGSPSFIEVDTVDFSSTSKGMSDKRTRNTHNEHNQDSTRNNTNNSTRELETMLRLVNNNDKKQFERDTNLNAGKRHFDWEANYKEDMLAEFDKLNVRGRRHQKRLLHRTQSKTNNREPSVNNRSTVDLQLPFFPKYDERILDEKWSKTGRESTEPRYEPSAPIPSYSAVGFSSPASTRRYVYK